ncbi:hypothetical protein DSO57_1013992 [Entomophthora muscae]|uniref:Uncharacterized protein n=1 Tax=Entomophthora muscae TaxID=34485 RepID=A0ACC2TT79_9FUNG|nr:hypothetical protein DSO57_1013992 [Entomophthora muscae]
MVPANGPWALLGKYLSYIVKLAPFLWWALPTGPAGCLPASSPETATGWLPETPGGLFSLIDFAEYPMNLAYSEFTLEKILFANPLVRSCNPEIFSREDYWYTVHPCLFRDKYNQPYTYLVCMFPPVTPWADHLQDLGC